MPTKIDKDFTVEILEAIFTQKLHQYIDPLLCFVKASWCPLRSFLLCVIGPIFNPICRISLSTSSRLASSGFVTREDDERRAFFPIAECLVIKVEWKCRLLSREESVDALENMEKKNFFTSDKRQKKKRPQRDSKQKSSSGWLLYHLSFDVVFCAKLSEDAEKGRRRRRGAFKVMKKKYTSKSRSPRRRLL